jgi:hypothetical protein
MAVRHRSTATAEATMTLLVPRDAAGDLLAGARRRLDRVEAVRGVERMEVGGVRPGVGV